MLLNLNAVMSIIANVPAAIASTVGFLLSIYYGVTWRLSFSLIRLLPVVPFDGSRTIHLLAPKFTGTYDPCVCLHSRMNSHMALSSNNATGLAFRSQHSQGHPIDMPPRKIVDGVHVQMNTFISPSESESVRSLKHYGHGSPDEAHVRSDKEMPPEESADEGFDVETQRTLKSPPFLWLTVICFPLLLLFS